jgi:hypothetical protein
MGKQTSDRASSILIILLLVFFAISVTAVTLGDTPPQVGDTPPREGDTPPREGDTPPREGNASTNTPNIGTTSDFAPTHESGEVANSEERDLAKNSGYRRGHNAGVADGQTDGLSDSKQHSNNNYFKHYDDKAPANSLYSTGTLKQDYENGYSNGYNVGYNAAYDDMKSPLPIGQLPRTLQKQPKPSNITKTTESRTDSGE